MDPPRDRHRITAYFPPDLYVLSLGSKAHLYYYVIGHLAMAVTEHFPVVNSRQHAALSTDGCLGNSKFLDGMCKTE